MGDRNRKDWKSNSSEYRREEYRKRRDAGKTIQIRDRDKNRDSNLRRYGISHVDYLRILNEQDEQCRICGMPEKYNTHGRLEVDHDHATGLVRGLLCGRCNKAIGLMLDDAGLLEAAANYLRRQ